MLTVAGTGRHCTTGTAAYCAYPPPATRAQTRAPTAYSLTSAPTRTTSPDSSSPGMSVVPGGGGYKPLRCKTSGRFTPAAATRINTSRGPISGTGRCVGCRTSGGPGSRISIAVMLPGTAEDVAAMDDFLLISLAGEVQQTDRIILHHTTPPL